MHYYLEVGLQILVLVSAVSLVVKLLPKSVLLVIAYYMLIAVAFLLGMLTMFKIVEGILNTVCNILFG